MCFHHEILNKRQKVLLTWSHWSLQHYDIFFHAESILSAEDSAGKIDINLESLAAQKCGKFTEHFPSGLTHLDRLAKSALISNLKANFCNICRLSQSKQRENTKKKALRGTLGNTKILTRKVVCPEYVSSLPILNLKHSCD